MSIHPSEGQERLIAPVLESTVSRLPRVMLVCVSAILFLVPAATAQPLSLGAYPCLTNDLPSGYGTFVVVKSSSYLQSAVGGVSEDLDVSSRALIELVSPNEPSITNAVVHGPGDLQIGLAPAATGTRALIWSGSYSNEAAMDTALPAGPWNSRIAVDWTNFGGFVGFFPFVLAAHAPPTPRFTNADRLSQIDPTTNLVVSWEAWTDATADDRIYFEAVDPRGAVVFSASTDCRGDVRLPPGATSVELPGGKLTGPSQYTFHVTFAAAVLANQDRSALLVERGFQARTTRLSVSAGGTATGDAILSNPRNTAEGDALLFRLTGEPRALYHIQWTTNLAVWNLQTAVTLPDSGFADVRLPLGDNGGLRLWRAIRPEPATDDEAAKLTIVEQTAQNRMLITIQGKPGIVYRLESTTNFVDWTQLPFGLNVAPATGLANFGVPFNHGEGINAYRVVGTPP